MGLGLKVGYTGTLMTFWDGNSLSTTNAPKRSANIVSYEHEVFEHWKVAVSMESKLAPTETSGLTDFNFSNPVYVGRVLYETDDVTVHMSGLVHRADLVAPRSVTLTRKLDPEGVLDIFDGASGRATIRYLSLSAEL